MTINKDFQNCDAQLYMYCDQSFYAGINYSEPVTIHMNRNSGTLDIKSEHIPLQLLELAENGAYTGSGGNRFIHAECVPGCYIIKGKLPNNGTFIAHRAIPKREMCITFDEKNGKTQLELSFYLTGDEEGDRCV